MMGRTHLAAGLVAGILVAEAVHGLTPVLAVGVSGVAALLPDIDHPNSMISNALPLIGKVISKVLPHRGPTHSILAVAALALLAHWIVPRLALSWILVGVCGYASHLVLDAATEHGILPLWPLRWRLSLFGRLVHTGGIIERWLVFPVLSAGFCLELLALAGVRL